MQTKIKEEYKHQQQHQKEYKKEEEGSKDQEFTYQNQISENLEFRTPNIQTLRNPTEPIQQSFQLLLQQPVQQQPLQQPPQQPNLDPMAYAPIVKLDNFISKEDDTQISNSESLPKLRSNYLPTNNTVTNLSTTSISNSSLSNTCNLLITATSNLSVTTLNYLSTPTTNLNTATKLASKWNPKAENDTTKLVIGDDSPPTDFQFVKPANRISSVEFGYWCHPKPKFPELFKSPDYTRRCPTQEPRNQLILTTNIPPATITEDKSLAVIFPFEIEELSEVFLFSGAAIEEKPIMAMYTNAKIDGHSIKLILDSCQVDRTASARIITADGATKTSIDKIDNLLIEINGITVPIKILVIEATQYQAFVGNNWFQNGQHIQVPATCGHFKPNNVTSSMLLIDFEEEKPKPTWEAYQVSWANIKHNKLLPILNWEERNNKNIPERPLSMLGTTTMKTNQCQPTGKKKGKGKEKEEDLLEKADEATEKITTSERATLHSLKMSELSCQTKTTGCEPITTANYVIENTIVTQNDKASGTTNHVLLANNISGSGGTCNTLCQYTILISDWVTISYLEGYPHNENKIWQMANAKMEGASPSEILEIKNNPPEPTNIVLVLNPDVFLNLENSPEEFHEHYQNLAPTRKEQEQRLEEINT
ncbi:hypothetical protein G9A89_000800 [Geosiphon pyriformis]|nr:hypothetical protein G9A89_000800 [Geosiphon pyriformis]